MPYPLMFKAKPAQPIVSSQRTRLRFKQIHGSDRLVSVRISREYRAVGVSTSADEVVWFWSVRTKSRKKLLARR